MKSVLILIALMCSQSAFACLGEAQVIAVIKQVQKTGMMSCKAYIDVNRVDFYAASQVCPLDLSQIANEGVEVGMINGHDCAVEAGSSLNGVIVLNSAGVLRLE